jgi:hypothetical protein
MVIGAYHEDITLKGEVKDLEPFLLIRLVELSIHKGKNQRIDCNGPDGVN